MKIQKTFGEYPCQTVVLKERVAFDQDGCTDVSDEIGNILLQVPGYLRRKEQGENVQMPEEVEEQQHVPLPIHDKEKPSKEKKRKEQK